MRLYQRKGVRLDYSTHHSNNSSTTSHPGLKRKRYLVILLVIVFCASFKVAWDQVHLWRSFRQQQGSLNRPPDNEVVVGGFQKIQEAPLMNQGGVATTTTTTTRNGAQVVSRDRGHVTRQFSSIRLDDLKDLKNDDTFQKQQPTEDDADALKDREPIVKMLETAGVKHLETDIVMRLPTWKQVVDLYGQDVAQMPVVIGMERCEAFRKKVPLNHRLAAVAGMFNTGTNALWLYLKNNLKLPYSTNNNQMMQPSSCGLYQCQGFLERVPWGKHSLLSYRGNYNCAQKDLECKGYQSLDIENILPIVVIRDPYTWMQSMCKESYDVKWPHAHWNKDGRDGGRTHPIMPTHPLLKIPLSQQIPEAGRKEKDRHCPNLVPTAKEWEERHLVKGRWDFLRLKSQNSTTVFYRALGNNRTWPTLADLWVDWYQAYLDSDIPRLMVRFEDLLFHPESVIEKIQQCLGAEWKQEGMFHYVVDTAKSSHQNFKKQTGMISGIIKYGSGQTRLKGMTKFDMERALQVLTPNLMQQFSYNRPAIPEDAPLDFKKSPFVVSG